MRRTAWQRKPPALKEVKPSKLPPLPPREPASPPTLRVIQGGGATIKREVRIKAKRETRRRSSRVEDEAYLAWLRTQPCGLAAWALEQWVKFRIVIEIDPCILPIDPDHERRGVGMSQRASDCRAWSICRGHHDQRHGAARGFWGKMSKHEKAEFIAARIDEHRHRYHLEQLAGGPYGGM